MIPVYTSSVFTSFTDSDESPDEPVPSDDMVNGSPNVSMHKET